MASSTESIIEPFLDTTNVPQAAEDPLYGLVRAFEADASPLKVDLGVGAYRDENAKPWILPVVHKVRYSRYRDTLKMVV